MTAQRRRLRRAGGRWRILAHQSLPGGATGDSYHVGPDESDPDRSVTTVSGETYHARHIRFAGTELDEVVLGRWLHLEQMDATSWWMDVAGIHIHVRVDRVGRPVEVLLEHDDVIDGVDYRVPWPDGGGSVL